MELYTILLILMVLCAFWNVYATLRIFGALKNWGKPVSFTLLRLFAPNYAFDYRMITKNEIGKTGPWFYHWIIAINLALAFFIAAVALMV